MPSRSSPPNLHVGKLPEITGNVVANGTVGFGDPETVTVAALAIGVVEFAAVEPEERIVNREETAYTTPCVELRKTM